MPRKVLAGQNGAFSGRRHKLELPVREELFKFLAVECGSNLGEDALTDYKRALGAGLA